MYKWHNVAIAGLENRPECTHRALLDPDERWNGWVCPYFEKSEAMAMNAWLPVFDDRLMYSSTADSFTTSYDEECPEIFHATDIDGQKLYPIGDSSWTWVMVDDEF